ncbi:MAG: 4-hydroxy-tetrahydrodipicolinate reductase [Gammaproteobacteria bacterium]|nr:4-hydroxy-tetrahydrodipicolinate reductase [Gammaproteobacteria bacterium]
MVCNLGINGFLGRMGQSILIESRKHQDINVTVGCDLPDKIASADKFDNIQLTSDISKHDDMFDVIIDFSLPKPSLEIIEKCVKLNKPITIGTTGFISSQIQLIEKAARNIPILLAPNMSHGVNVSLGSLGMIAKSLKGYNIEISEIHHVNKVDSPSGTAIKMAQVICDSQKIDLGDVHSPDCPIKFVSARENTEIGTHEVSFKGLNDEIRVKHIANDRSIFADGAIRTANWVKNKKNGLYTYNDYMMDML